MAEARRAGSPLVPHDLVLRPGRPAPSVAGGVLRRALRLAGLLLRVVLVTALGVGLAAASLGAAAAGLRAGAEVAAGSPLWRSLEGPVLDLDRPLPIPRFPERSTLYAADGSVLQHLYLRFNRTYVPLPRLPPATVRAVLAIEDARFYEHGPVDPLAVVRAAIANLRAGTVVQGASTISQQVVRNARAAGIGREVTLERKLKEVLAAWRLERTYGKDQILELYLNQVYLGHGTYGLGAAARYYFGVAASRLTLAQSALLAGMIAAPQRFDPITSPAAARERRAAVLQRMLELGWIDGARYDRAASAPLGLSPLRRRAAAAGPTTFWEQHVVQSFLGDPRFGETFRQRKRLLFQGGLRIFTTLDPRLQRVAERVLRERMTGPGLPQSALVAVEPGTGAIRAMAVGNWPFGRRRYNLATAPGGGRSAGSAFKVFTLAAALLEGIPPSRVYNGDSPKVVRTCGGGETWRLRNAEPGSGNYTLAQATVHSVNTVFAQVIDEVGPETVARVAHRMGIASPLVPVCPLTLGTSAVTPLEMTAAVATLASGGVACEPYAIERVVGPGGELLFRAEPRCHRALPAWVAALETSILQEVVRSGTGWRADIGRPAAGKTGTAQDHRDAWFVGYVPQLAAGVWVGYARAELPIPALPGYGPAFGGVLAAPIWHDFMASATGRLPVEAFPPPPEPPALPTPPPPPSPSAAPGGG